MGKALVHSSQGGEHQNLWPGWTVAAHERTAYENQHFTAIAWTMTFWDDFQIAIMMWVLDFSVTSLYVSGCESYQASYQCSGIHPGLSWNHADMCTRSCLLCWYTHHHHTRWRLLHTHPHLEKNKPTVIMFLCKPSSFLPAVSIQDQSWEHTGQLLVLRTVMGWLKPLVDS